MENEFEEDIIWRSVLDEHTCDRCRALHNKPIKWFGPAPPLHFRGNSGCQAPHWTGCRCYALNVTRLKAELIRDVGVAYRFERVGAALDRMVVNDMISRKESIKLLSRCVREAVYTVRFEIIGIINEFTYEANEP